MRRVLPTLIGLAIVAGAGAMHGVKTERWQPSQALTAAAERLECVPNDIDGWRAEALELPAGSLELAGARRAVVRRYVDQSTGNTLYVSLMVGPSGQMAVHRPEHCYVGSGFNFVGGAVRVPLTLADGTRAEFWTSRFEKPEPGGSRELRIFWSWRAGNDWRAPESPRWALADLPYLYKLYVVRETFTKAERIEEDPSVEFLQLLLPRLNEVLAEP
jgi:hypothetical protein